MGWFSIWHDGTRNLIDAEARLPKFSRLINKGTPCWAALQSKLCTLLS